MEGTWRGNQRMGLAAAAAAIALAACSEEPEQAAGAPPVRPAKLVEVAAAETVRAVVLPAEIEASDSADLAFQVAGVVESIAAREGEQLAQGAEIARLDQRELQIALATARTEYDAADAEFQRGESLVAQGAISPAAQERRKTQRDLARSALDAARKRFDDGVLLAPFAGVVAAVHTEAFQNVAAGAAVVTLQSAAAVEAVVAVPSRLVAESGRFEPLEIALILDAAPDSPVPATFRSIAARADPARQVFDVRFSFTPPAGLVTLPGMTGTLRATAALPGEAGVAVPVEAILAEADARYVWVVDLDSMTVAKRRVTTGEGVGPELPVADGLEPGETIVAAGVSRLHDGMRIRRYTP